MDYKMDFVVMARLTSVASVTSSATAMGTSVFGTRRRNGKGVVVVAGTSLLASASVVIDVKEALS